MYPLVSRTVDLAFPEGVESPDSRQEDLPCSLFFFDNVDQLHAIFSQVVTKYLKGDDLFCETFLENVLISLPNKAEKSPNLSKEVFLNYGVISLATWALFPRESWLISGLAMLYRSIVGIRSTNRTCKERQQIQGSGH